MLDGVNLHAAFAKRRTAGGINHIVYISFYNRLIFKVNSTKTDSRIYGSRVEGEGAALTSVETCSLYTDSIFERTLFLHKKSNSWIFTHKKRAKVGNYSSRAKKNRIFEHF